MDLNEWIIKGEVGVSSRTMWYAISGIVTTPQPRGNGFDYPYDPDDLRRCFLFVSECNITKEQLQKVKEIFVWWTPFIDNWDSLIALFKTEFSIARRCPATYGLIQDLIHESKQYQEKYMFCVIKIDDEYITNVGYDAIDGFVFKTGAKENAIKFSKNASMEINIHEILNKYGIANYTVEML